MCRDEYSLVRHILLCFGHVVTLNSLLMALVRQTQHINLS